MPSINLTDHLSKTKHVKVRDIVLFTGSQLEIK